MKKSSLLLACLATLGITSAQAETVTLKVGHFLPSTSNAQVNIIQPWCDDLNKESNGRIVCQLYPSMQLGGTPPRLVDMVRSGVADVVWTAPAYSAGRFPRVEVLELPFVLPYGGKAGNEIIWDFYEQYAQADFEGYKVLVVHGDGGMDLHTRSKAISNLADMRGLKLRASSRTAAKTLESLGITPVSMPPAQMTESISRGVVDGALASWEVVPATKLDEVTRYHSVMPEGQPAVGYTVLTLLMNQQRYDSLPADLKAIIDRHSGRALSQRFYEAWDVAMDAAIAATPAEQLIPIALSDYQAMQAATQPVIEQWIQDNSKNGIDGKALVDGLRQLTAGQ